MRGSKFHAALIIILLGVMLSASFPLEATSGVGSAQISPLQADTFQVSANPDYIQEGLNTTLTVTVQAAINTTYPFKINVTDPLGAFFVENISVTTNPTGFGANTTQYWGNFSGARTDFVGVYNVLLKNATTGETLHSANFAVGLTDKSGYRRNEDVGIRGSGYAASENVTIDLKTGGVSVVGYPKNVTANTEGVVNDIWLVPIDATAGNYNLTMTNATSPGTVKLAPDTQTFSVFQTFYVVDVVPSHIPKGQNTTITATIGDAAINTAFTLVINVTDPGGISFNKSLSVTTNATGYGSSSTKYWGDFTGANTDYAGVYTVKINETLATTNLTVFTVSVAAQPNRVQEGMNTTITTTLNGAAENTTYPFTITVIDPGGRPYDASLAVDTNATGFGSNSIKYWGNFAGATNYVGNYTVTVKDTLATTDFLVSLTDKKEPYRRNETVQIQATGYNPSESVTLDIKVDTLQVGGFPQTIRADDKGKVAYPWKIPLNATRGNYTVTLSNATSGGTVKTPKDTQVFEVVGVLCRIQTKNQAGQSLEGVLVEAYNASTNMLLAEGTTVSTGLIRFNLDVGNYTVKTLWKGVEVGNFNESIKQDTDLEYKLNLTNVRIIVNDENSEGIPLIDLSFSYNYTIGTLPRSEVVPRKTNASGIVEILNVFTNVKYSLQAWRYDFPLPKTPIENETLLLPWNIITIAVLKYTAFIQVLDSKGSNVTGVRIVAYEWSSGTTQPAPTGTQTSVTGSVTFSLTFGKYRLRAFDNALLLNETALDLIVNNLNFTFQLAIFNMDTTVWVRDYFGQPITNANVTIERKMGEEYVFAYSRLTGSDGSAEFASTVGGDSRISVNVGGKLVAVKAQFLSGSHSSVEFRVADYVAILGYPMPAGLFTLLVFLSVFAVVVLVLTRGRLMKAFGKKPKK